MGDIIAYGVVVTPDREKRVAFSTPITDKRNSNHRNRIGFGAAQPLPTWAEKRYMSIR